MATDIFTGYKGAVYGVDCVREWGYSITTKDEPAFCSSSDGTAVRTAGNKDWEFYWEAYGLTPKLTHRPGEDFVLSASAVDGGGVTAASSIIYKWQIDYPVELGGFINNRVDIQCSSDPIVADAVTQIPDLGTPNPKSASGYGCDLVGHIKHMRIILERKNAETYDGGANGWITRLKGNLEATAIIRVNVSPTFAGLPAINSLQAVEMGTNSDGVATWTFTQMKVMAIKPVVSIEGEQGRPKFVGSDIFLGFSGYNSGDKGSIVSPVGQLWP